MLICEQVSVQRANRYLLRDISLSLQPGEVLALIGANGAGKSTLLQVMSGDLRPTSGKILLDDRQISTWPAAILARKRAVLPQHSTLTFPFTAREVVRMGCYPHSHPRGDLEEILDAVMALTDTVHLAKRPYTTLSGGERQRVQLARVLAQVWEGDISPRYLFLDEPTSALDLSHQHTVLAAIRAFTSTHQIGMVVVLHDLNLAATHADRIALLRLGKLVAAGEPQQVLQEKCLTDVFDWPMRVLPHPLNRNALLVVPILGDHKQSASERTTNSDVV